MVEGGATYFLVKDHLGSTRAVLNSSNTPMIPPKRGGISPCFYEKHDSTWYSYDVYGNNIGSRVNQDVRYKLRHQFNRIYVAEIPLRAGFTGQPARHALSSGGELETGIASDELYNFSRQELFICQHSAWRSRAREYDLWLGIFYASGIVGQGLSLHMSPNPMRKNISDSSFLSFLPS